MMRSYQDILTEGFIDAVNEIYGFAVDQQKLIISVTRKEFAGDYTLVLFPFLKDLKIKPLELGEKVGNYLVENYAEINGFNIIQGFLNIEFSQEYWTRLLNKIHRTPDFGGHPENGQKAVIEFSSPNTNKPLHLGHVRNICLGWSCSKILEKAGYEVIRVQIVNDRGIAICKSMLAWQKYGNNRTPASENVKGDHFVGEYYVRFEQEFKIEYQSWQQSAAGKAVFEKNRKEEEAAEAFFSRYKNEYFNQYSTLGLEAKQMLLAWENGDPKVRALWNQMNSWVYEGFGDTYQLLQVQFDKLYYESDTYLLGKSTIELGLEKGLFYREKDGSVWIDLEDAGYDKKILLRSDGTSVYMTQDIGTAIQRNQDFHPDVMVYTVADEQDYHFQVLFEILKRLGEPYAEKLYHLSYGMVELPDGKMKSREGTVVDADDLIQTMVEEAREAALERGELAGETPEESEDILRRIALGAIKFFILKVTPKKRMIFNPSESLDMQGQTGPYIQNAYVRIRSILRRIDNLPEVAEHYDLHLDEKELIQMISDYPVVIKEAAEKYDPSNLANYNYQLAKAFHKFYHDFRILGAESEEAKSFRIVLISNISRVLRSSMDLLGIEMPERM